MKNSLSPILLLLCVSLLISCERKKDDVKIENEKTEEKHISIEDRCKEVALLDLKTNLVDPDSYVGEGWQIEVEEDTTLSPLKYTVLHQYRAKNSFGGYVRNVSYFFLTEEFEIIDSFDQSTAKARMDLGVRLGEPNRLKYLKESVIRSYRFNKRHNF